MKRRDLLRSVRSAALRLLIPLLTQTVGRLPYRAVAILARGLAGLLLATNRRDRQRSLEHLAMAFPEAGEEELRRLQRECFLNASLNALETLGLLARGREPIDRRLEIEGWENFDNEAGKRILLLSCHSGFWEMLGVAMARHERTLFSIGRRADDPAFRKVVSRVREAVGVQNVERGTAAGRRYLKQALKGEGALAILIDQDTLVDGTWVPFFNRPAFTPVGAAEMALKHGMRVVPAFLERRADGVHVARFHPALDLPANAAEATAMMTSVIEDHIRRNPAQWVWWHRRWRRQPEDD